MPLQWLHQWTPCLTIPTYADGGSCHQTCAQSASRLGVTASKPWHMYSVTAKLLCNLADTTRHDCVLEILFKHLQQYLPPGTTVVADLPGYPYTLPTDVPTDLSPDLVVHSPGQLHLLELTLCWESNFSAAKLRKESKYLHLVEQARGRGVQASLSTAQIGCRGFVDSKSLQHFFALTQPALKPRRR